jgi:Photosynthetic reaction centre cytochrome C subunit
MGQVSRLGQVSRVGQVRGARRLQPSVVLLGIIFVLNAAAASGGQQPAVGMVESPNVKILTGLTVPQFEHEMQLMTTALGVGCGFCHVRGNFASENNAHKATARKMLEMTRAINQQFFPDYQPASDEESRLGRVTCSTCHQGSDKPK